jgi:hypothetical protein
MLLGASSHPAHIATKHPNRRSRDTFGRNESHLEDVSLRLCMGRFDRSFSPPRRHSSLSIDNTNKKKV